MEAASRDPVGAKWWKDREAVPAAGNGTDPFWKRDDFYTHPLTRQWYKDYVRALLARTNSVSGVRYADDTNIFAWELLNEPRCEKCAGALNDWITEMAAYVKSLDPRHMVTPGVDGFYSDEFTEEMLRAEGCNVRLLMDHRAARPRFYDALCAAILAHFVENTSGDAEWSLTFDGIDPRGFAREFNAPREPGILSSDDEFWRELLYRKTPIGEGDLKLTDVAQRVHDAAKHPSTPVHGVVLNLLVTIDTDSLVIELLKQQARLARTDERDRNELSIVCLKEPARKRKGDDFVTPARFLCCNAARFHASVADYLAPARSEDRDAAVALLVAACACCGCDFLEVKGTRADLMLPVVKDVVRRHPEVLRDMARVFAEEQATVREAKPAIDTVLKAYAEDIATKPRMKRSHASASNYCDAQVLRALWTVSYWCGREFLDCADWGFASESVA